MRKSVIITLALGLAIAMTSFAWAADGCVTIQDGTLTAKDGVTFLTTGYDDFGYNYQAHIFNGRYCDYDRVIGGTDCDVDLIMKWSDNWLSNVDCNEDNLLDRGLDSSTGEATGVSEGWCTNHQSGKYIAADGRKCKWTYFVKIVYVGPAPDPPEEDPWADYRIWGSYAIVQSVYNDQCEGYHGIEFKPIVAPGLGQYTQQEEA